MFLSIIRPGKKHLQGLPWNMIEKTVWDGDNSDGYVFKRSHELSVQPTLYITYGNIRRNLWRIKMTGIELIAAERERQVSVKGWTLEHDDEHTYGELVDAAICYAQCESYANTSNIFPWEKEFWKPSDDPIRNLSKAGALIAAEIDRLRRCKLKIFEAGVIGAVAPYDVRWTGDLTKAVFENEAMTYFENHGYYRNLAVREVV